MGKRLSQEELDSRFAPRFKLMEPWRGWHEYHWFYDNEEKDKFYMIAAQLIKFGKRKSKKKYPKRNHGCTYEPWYKSYEAMIRRSSGKHQSKAYKEVDVCSEWLEDPNEFGKWAMKNGYKPGLTIDRINPTEGYYPENCQWVTLHENLRRSHISSPVQTNGHGRIIGRKLWAGLKSGTK